MSSNYTVSLHGPAPWGFRLQGGKDFSMPLTISRLTDQGKAAKAHIAVGDTVLSIDGISTDGMNHLEAQNKIKACTGNLNLTLQRASAVPKPPVAPKTEPSEFIETVPVISQRPRPLPCEPTRLTSSAPHNKTAQPFGGCGGEDRGYPTARYPHSAFAPASPVSPPSLPQPPLCPSSLPPSLPAAPQPSVYNMPINLCSNENACEVATGQRRGLMGSQEGDVQVNGVSRKPIIDTDIEFYHVPSHGDASKKRLMQDTEDWHPRSGTTQSRSFRILAQITGTEHQESPEKGKERDPGKTKEDGGESEVSSNMLSMIKTKTKGPAGPNKNTNTVSTAKGSGFPKPSFKAGVMAPSIGVRGDSSTSAPPNFPVSERPAPPPHPTDEASLVQMAEHIPAGTRTPMCGHCNMVIRGPFLVAMGKSWHPEEFNCAHCRTSLADIGFVEEQGSVFCEHCYEEFLAPTCSRCQLKILGEVINALKQTWHVHCFLCTTCQRPIRDDTFHLEDGEPYCERDFYALFGTGCHGCEFPIEAGDKFLEALGFTWHDTCFVCAVCCATLEGQAFFSKMDKPLCKKHAHTVVKH
ncbi:PDZ and LIM domain protein 5a isoform X2 [Esox lucius]|uniref:PDZ and LIM domain 5a n=1 Tax=Esox lucius TaxID=8010 RepID=A0A3P9AHA0_ESOLU|nr:PDZ and LIM domain protein 5a isoform X2 [Esox lucius]